MGSKASKSCAHDAVFYNNPNALRMLKQNGCSLDKTDRLGYTPLHLACKLKPDQESKRLRLECLEILLDAGCDQLKKDRNGLIPLMLALRNQFTEAADMIYSRLPPEED